MKTTLAKRSALALVLTSAMAFSGTSAYATGIPVVDGAAIAQSVTNHIENIAQMAKQLTEAQKQLQQMKQQYQAITGNKGSADILKNGGISDDILSSFEDLMKGNTADIAQRVQDYFGKNINCPDGANKAFCTAEYEGIIKEAYAEKLNTELQNRLQKVQELSQRAQSANDAKSMQELQANIALEANAIAILKQQSDNFERLQEAQKEIAIKKAKENYFNDAYELYHQQKNSTKSTGENSEYSAIFQ